MAPSITSMSPADSATDVSRSARLVVVIEDPVSTVDTLGLTLRYEQTDPVDITNQGENTVVLAAGVFGAAWIGTIVVESINGGAGERVTYTAQPRFGHCPAAYLQVTASFASGKGSDLAIVSWLTVEYAPPRNLRVEMLKVVKQLTARYGWDPLLTAKASYRQDADPNYTGSELDITLNASFAAWLGDQMPKEAFGISIFRNVRHVRLLAKLSEYPRDAFDPEAKVLFAGQLDGGGGLGLSGFADPVVADVTSPGDQLKSAYVDDKQQEGVPRYITLFLLVPPSDDFPDWRWAYSDAATFISAFAYGAWGHGARMFANMPREWQALDGES